MISSDNVIAIIAVCAIFSPAIVSIIDNVFRYIFRRIDVKNLEKKESITFIQKVYAEYLESAGRCFHNSSLDNIKLYGEKHAIALAFFPKKYQPMLLEINSYALADNYEQSIKLLNALAIELSDSFRSELSLSLPKSQL